MGAAVKGTFTLALYIAIGTIGAAFGQEPLPGQPLYKAPRQPERC
jgi:hypothetical protein